MRKGLLVVLFGAALAQAAPIIPAERTFVEAWQNAGYPGQIPAPAHIVNVRDFQAADDLAAIMAAIHSLSNAPGVVYLPAGTYHFHSAINLPAGVVLRGESPATTRLHWDHLGYCINVAATQKEKYQPVTAGATIHSRTIEVGAGHAFARGDYAEIREDNHPAWGASKWAEQTVGQILRITAVTGNKLTLERPLRINYSAAQNPVLRKITPVTEVGIENLTIDRAVAGTDTARCNIYTIFFNYAARCWVRGIDGNVFGYNYSREPLRTEIPAEISSDITVHGNYPYANLFEGNLCQHIWIDDSHNANGPLNTFFRNRAESYGIYMSDHAASNQNFVGNETFTGPLSLLFNPAGYRLVGGGHFEYGNRLSATKIQPPGTTNLTDYSYYLTNASAVLPPIEIPAYTRFRSGKQLTVPE